MSSDDTMQVTISLLPVCLSLVHIPRSRLAQLSHPVLHEILRPDPVFLNVTCNEIELSLFADSDSLKVFDPIAAKDRRRKAKAKKKLKDANEDEAHDGQVQFESVEVSDERWRVLQIDSHSDRLDTSGARVHDLSTPLAFAGISILYQSSYTSDFLLVKSSRLASVLRLLANSGFDLYCEDSERLVSGMSPILSPVDNEDDERDREDEKERQLSEQLEEMSMSLTLSRRGSMAMLASSAGSAAVLTRTRSSTDASTHSLSSIAMASLLKERNHSFSTPGHSPRSNSEPSPVRPQLQSRTPSHSPSSTDVRMLDTDLTCVGLSEDAANVWTLKIVTLVAFPDVIPGVRQTPHASSILLQRPPSPPPLSLSSSSSSSSSICSDEDEDMSYFERTRDRNHSISASSISSDVSIPESEDEKDDDDYRSCLGDAEDAATPGVEDESTAFDPQNQAKTPQSQLSALPDLDGTPGLPPSTPPAITLSNPDLSDFPSTGRGTQKPASHIVPFFSFTRTQESSSLTTDVSLLAKMFPPNERHMVICSGELDGADSLPSPTEANQERDGEEGEEDDDAKAGGEDMSLMKCLQIDLRRYGLDKHGLVNRFSRVLEENGVNHMYSSTFMSANLLVDKKNAKRAQALLRSS